MVKNLYVFLNYRIRIFFYHQLNPKKPPLVLNQESKFILLSYKWPGNIRQLHNIVEWFSILLGETEHELCPKHLPNELKNTKDQAQQESYELFDGSLKEAREKFEKDYLTSQLKKHKGNISKTAEFIGMERSALHRKLKTLGIKVIN